VTSPRTVRLLVCGERLRSDDGAALLAVDRLTAAERQVAEVFEVGQLTVEALLEIPDGVAVILADAAVGVTAGAVVVVPLAKIANRVAAVSLGTAADRASPASSHALPPDQVLAIAEELHGSPLRGVFVGIGGENFGFGEGLSEAVAAGLPALTDAIAAEIHRLASAAEEN
jgi:hydrogenase maturation protease